MSGHENPPGVSSGSAMRSSSVRKRRRVYDPTGLDITPYRKKPKLMKSNLMSISDPRRQKYDEMKDIEMWQKYILWMADPSLNEESPMCVGWNAMVMPIDGHCRQRIWYLPQINQSPTSNDFVVEALRRSLCIAAESKKQSIAVTYDLAIAKLAMQIQ